MFSRRTKESQTNSGQVALVDAEEFEWLSKFKWHAHKRGQTWYARRAALGKTEFMLRTILESQIEPANNLPCGKYSQVQNSGEQQIWI
jgi:hypothetical protein